MNHTLKIVFEQATGITLDASVLELLIRNCIRLLADRAQELVFSEATPESNECTLHLQTRFQIGSVQYQRGYKFAGRLDIQGRSGTFRIILLNALDMPPGDPFWKVLDSRPGEKYKSKQN